MAIHFIEHNSPHIRRKRTARACMWHVIAALAPTTLCAFWYFGLPAVAVTAVAVATCVIGEYLMARYLMGDAKLASLTAAALTGLLLALNLPSGIELWMVVAGSLFAIGVGKMAFGGLGCNIFNPALCGRVFMLISFPAAMTVFADPGSAFMAADGQTGATILSALKEGILPDSSYRYADLFIGNMRGSMGEVASIAILLGLGYLLAMRVISWHIPAAILAAVTLFDLAIGIPPGLDILSGGLLLGAVFMATDYVTSPMTRKGMLVYGFAIGIITVAIRRWGAYPEGMSFAILLMNGATPLINRFMSPKRYGYVKPSEKAAV